MSGDGMNMTMLDFCQWLTETAPALLVRESDYGFQVFVALHLLGIAFSVGILLWFDLRLMGVWAQRSRVSVLYRGLAPWFLVGYAVMFVTGAMLFAAYAPSAYGNTAFRVKLVALVLAGVNAVVYHYTAGRKVAEWDDAVPPPGVRIAGLSSLALWLVVIVAGRLTSYTMF
jgi:hypothetical protein